MVGHRAVEALRLELTERPWEEVVDTIPLRRLAHVALALFRVLFGIRDHLHEEVHRVVDAKIQYNMTAKRYYDSNCPGYF